MPALTNAFLHERRQAVTPRGATTLAPFFADRAKNAELWDIDGRRYIDFAGGVGVLNTGHLHPHITAAVASQLERFSHTCYTVAPYAGYVELAERLTAIAPIDGAKKALFVTTGAEAVENAVKVARAYTGRSAVIAFSGGFHGRTLLGMALTGKVAPYKAGFGPFPPEIFHVPFPTGSVAVDDSMEALQQLLKTSVEPRRIAAIIVEPVQGEGGFHVAPPELLLQLRVLCDRYGILLIADEVQAGFGRTGRWFGIEHSGVQPDLITIGKSLAGGYPLAGLIGRAEVMDAAEPGGLGGTYAGSPVGIAAALAVLTVIQEDGLLQRSLVLGKRLRQKLEVLRARVPQISDLRGLGSMVAVEFCEPSGGLHAYDAAFAKCVQARAMERGLILLTCGTGASAIRFLYPLTIEDRIFDEALDILVEAIEGAL